VSIDIAERNGSLFRRRLRSAERLSERAIATGSFLANTLCSRSSASLVRVTRCDHRFRRTFAPLAPRLLAAIRDLPALSNQRATAFCGTAVALGRQRTPRLGAGSCARTPGRSELTGATEATMIRKLKSGKYRLYSRKRDPKTGRARNLGTFDTREAAEAHERAVQFFKRRG
jgi:hypothetical protein